MLHLTLSVFMQCLAKVNKKICKLCSEKKKCFKSTHTSRTLSQRCPTVCDACSWCRKHKPNGVSQNYTLAV